MKSIEPSGFGDPGVVTSSTHLPAVNLARIMSVGFNAPSSSFVSVNVIVAFVVLVFNTADGVISRTFSVCCDCDGRAVNVWPSASDVGSCLNALTATVASAADTSFETVSWSLVRPCDRISAGGVRSSGFSGLTGSVTVKVFVARTVGDATGVEEEGEDPELGVLIEGANVPKLTVDVEFRFAPFLDENVIVNAFEAPFAICGV